MQFTIVPTIEEFEKNVKGYMSIFDKDGTYAFLRVSDGVRDVLFTKDFKISTVAKISQQKVDDEDVLLAIDGNKITVANKTTGDVYAVSSKLLIDIIDAYINGAGCDSVSREYVKYFK
jgi:hypothetical protein